MKLTITAEGVAKVTPDRAYGVTVHPSTSKLITAIGDRDGNVGKCGFWKHLLRMITVIGSDSQVFGMWMPLKTLPMMELWCLGHTDQP